MFDKLKGLFEKESQPEFRPREQKKFNRETKPVSKSEQEPQPEHKSDGKSILIGADPFNRKSEIGTEQRIEGKIQLLKQLQEELDEYGKA